MNIIKTLFATLTVFALGIFMFTDKVLAGAIANPAPNFTIEKLFQGVIKLIPIVIVIGAFGGVVVMAATLIFGWAQSGDAEPVKKVRSIAMYMIAGIMIVILAPFLLALLLNLMGVTGLGNLLPF